MKFQWRLLVIALNMLTFSIVMPAMGTVFDLMNPLHWILGFAVAFFWIQTLKLFGVKLYRWEDDKDE